MNPDGPMVRKLIQVERRLDNLVKPPVGHRVSEYNIANPPTNGQLNAAFPNAYNGFVGLVNDNGDGIYVVLVARVDDSWWYEVLTLAV
jgi:hypothetical protein